MSGWLTDTFRLAWGAFFWNARKTAWRARGRPRPCPCQIASDSGRAGETGCEAAVAYHAPGRFRLVCPLLTRQTNGRWVCSVETREVRPFWGRALGLGSAALLVAFLLTTLGIFALLRGIGYDIRYTQVVWPPAWSEFRGIQAGLYLDHARAAHAAGDPGEALLNLSNAYELNPRDYAAGLLLAQLWQTTQPALADRTYARLFTEHPEQREATAEAWLRALLARGDFAGIQRIAGERLLNSGPRPASAWVQAFLFSTRRLGEDHGLERLLAEPDLPATLAPLLRLEHELSPLPASDQVAPLARALGATSDGYIAYHLASRLIGAGRPDLAMEAALAAGGPLGDRAKVRLRLDALAALGRVEERAARVHDLLARPTHPAINELLAAHLILYPDAVLLRAWSDKLRVDPLPAGDVGYPQLLAFFAAAAIPRDPEGLATATQWIQAAVGRDFRALEALRDALLAPGPPPPLEGYLPVIQPLPLEVVYALYDRHPPAPFIPSTPTTP